MEIRIVPLLKINHVHIGRTSVPMYHRNVWLVLPALITCGDGEGASVLLQQEAQLQQEKS